MIMKQIFTLLCCIILATTLSAQITITNDSLLAYYNFENSGNNQFADRFHLTPVVNAGHDAPSYHAGKLGNSVYFNKNNALVNTNELANHLAASQSKSLSLSFWVIYSNANTSLSTFVEFFESLFMRNSNLTFGMLGSGNAWSSTHANAMLNNQGWRHVVVVYDAPSFSLQLYLDGELTRQLVINGNDMMRLTPNFILGAGTNNNVFNWTDKGFEGRLDEMYLYNRVLSASEVLDLFYLRVAPATEVSGDKLVAYYDFNTDANNKAGNNFNLTAVTLNSEVGAPAFINDGKAGGAASFNGNNAFWNQTEFASYSADSDKSLTISTWIRHRNNNTKQFFTMFELFESMFLRSNVSFGISRANAIFNATSGNVSLPPNQWVHVTAIYDQVESQIRLHVNGDLRATITGITGFHAYNSVFMVGAGANNATPNFATKGFVGDIDEMYIFNRVLNKEEIYGMMNMSPVVITSVRNAKFEPLTLYPNPAQSKFIIETGSEEIKSVRIFDVSGKVLLRTNQKEIDISNFSQGVYFVKIETANGNTHVQRLQKK